MTNQHKPEDIDVDLPEPSAPRQNLNTILLAVVIAVLLGMGGISVQNSNKLSELTGAMIGRPEFETKLTEIKNQQEHLETEIFTLKLKLAQVEYGRKGDLAMANKVIQPQVLVFNYPNLPSDVKDVQRWAREFQAEHQRHMEDLIKTLNTKQNVTT